MLICRRIKVRMRAFHAPKRAQKSFEKNLKFLLTFREDYVIINKLSRETTRKLLKTSAKNLENQRSINTQTLKILRIFRDRKGQKCR